ncbi:MAG: FeoA family protein [Desulfovibrionaceae bacterium]|nr:FeoA family protein [Desulfovibrionaceae bacterium]
MSPYGPLSQFPAGSRVRIEKLCECSRARGRLCAMGLTPGTEIEVFANCGGPCCLKVRGSSLTLGHGLARSIFGRIVTVDPDATVAA